MSRLGYQKTLTAKSKMKSKDFDSFSLVLPSTFAISKILQITPTKALSSSACAKIANTHWKGGSNYFCDLHCKITYHNLICCKSVFMPRRRIIKSIKRGIRVWLPKKGTKQWSKCLFFYIIISFCAMRGLISIKLPATAERNGTFRMKSNIFLRPGA